MWIDGGVTLRRIIKISLVILIPLSAIFLREPIRPSILPGHFSLFSFVIGWVSIMVILRVIVYFYEKKYGKYK